MSARPVAVVVIGDLSRSPRMWNHARELARRGHAVSLIGFGAPPENVTGIRVCALRSWRRPRANGPRWSFLLWAGMRMTLLFLTLVVRLIRERPRSILVQNPPSFPTLAAAWIAARSTRARLIVDWHNYGFTILALRVGRTHFIVRLAEWYEFAAGRFGDAHLCVSRAMRDDLKQRRIQARTLYDRPVERPQSSAGGVATVVVCPLGWTADDDVELLLDGLGRIDCPATTLEIYLTGDGPGRARLLSQIAAFSRPGVEIIAADLVELEYRRLLRRATVGVSLHRSSSGLDLAMKVVDLFAACVPVCALNYGGALPEQIEDGVTGFLFRDAEELAALFNRIVGRPAILDEMRVAIQARWAETWPADWGRQAGDLFGDREAAR